jgi:RNA polymerase subunit RPABC4/transcription elongation factor Spt4
MYRHLVRVIRSRFPQYLSQPFDVTELHQTILPYRLHRRELGLETNEDYEITLSELLSGARDYLIVDDRMRDTLKQELAAVNPDPSAFKQFASASVALSPASLRSLEAGPDDTSTPLRTMAVPAVESTRPEPAAPPPPIVAPPPAPVAQAPRTTTASTTPGGARAITPQPGEKCRSCDEVLPPGRPITFCPHCGQNLTTLNCAACGSELELGWKFCPVCGRGTAGR